MDVVYNGMPQSSPTIADTVQTAAEWLASDDPTDGHLAADVVSRFVVDLFDEAIPCGYEVSIEYGEVRVNGAVLCASAEAKALAAAILRALER